MVDQKILQDVMKGRVLIRYMQRTSMKKCTMWRGNLCLIARTRFANIFKSLSLSKKLHSGITVKDQIKPTNPK